MIGELSALNLVIPQVLFLIPLTDFRIHLAHRRRIYLAGIVSWSTANREVT
jgi:hypothetical protein